MAESPTGIIPEDLMYPGGLNKVMQILMSIPIPGDQKEAIFMGWARGVGVTVNSSQRAAVRDSGTDRQ